MFQTHASFPGGNFPNSNSSQSQGGVRRIKSFGGEFREYSESQGHLSAPDFPMSRTPQANSNFGSLGHPRGLELSQRMDRDRLSQQKEETKSQWTLWRKQISVQLDELSSSVATLLKKLERSEARRTESFENLNKRVADLKDEVKKDIQKLSTMAQESQKRVDNQMSIPLQPVVAPSRRSTTTPVRTSSFAVVPSPEITIDLTQNEIIDLDDSISEMIVDKNLFMDKSTVKCFDTQMNHSPVEGQLKMAQDTSMRRSVHLDKSVNGRFDFSKTTIRNPVGATDEKFGEREEETYSCGSVERIQIESPKPTVTGRSEEPVKAPHLKRWSLASALSIQSLLNKPLKIHTDHIRESGPRIEDEVEVMDDRSDRESPAKRFRKQPLRGL